MRTLRDALAPTIPVWYRRRWKNVGRKAGNIQEFVERWGGRYEYMVILDADSLIDGDTLVWMVRAMMADKTLGLVQTAPRLVGRMSLFARRSGSRSPGAGLRGLAAWAGTTVTTGAQRVLRIAAWRFCGLPQLPGARRPHSLARFRGQLMRGPVEGRWRRRPFPMKGRRRWWLWPFAIGAGPRNLQHRYSGGRIALAQPRLRIYLSSSPLWLMLLLVGLALAVQGAA